MIFSIIHSTVSVKSRTAFLPLYLFVPVLVQCLSHVRDLRQFSILVNLVNFFKSIFHVGPHDAAGFVFSSLGFGLRSEGGAICAN
jgi:hypothetical protein